MFSPSEACIHIILWWQQNHYSVTTEFTLENEPQAKLM